MTDEQRYESYVRWCESIGAPTSLSFEEWSRKASAPFWVAKAPVENFPIPTGEEGPCQAPECLYQGRCVCDGDQ